MIGSQLDFAEAAVNTEQGRAGIAVAIVVIPMMAFIGVRIS